VTDGITSVMSNQEIVDCVRFFFSLVLSKQVKLYDDPQTASKEIVNMAEQYGTEDNATCMVNTLNAFVKLKWHNN
jgi:protein phosphatase PTC6